MNGGLKEAAERVEVDVYKSKQAHTLVCPDQVT